MHERAVNLLGATALAVSDFMLDAATEAAGASASAAAALVVLTESEGLGASELGRRIGLTQSAASRMVDGLERRGLARRAAGVGREVGVALTDQGAATARRMLAARADQLDTLLAGLAPADQRTLADLLETLLTRAYARIGSSARICRLCDRAACVRAGSVCPVGQAERDHAAALDTTAATTGHP